MPGWSSFSDAYHTLTSKITGRNSPKLEEFVEVIKSRQLPDMQKFTPDDIRRFSDMPVFENHSTALHMAAQLEIDDVLECLLKYCEDTNVLDDFDMTPLMMAIKQQSMSKIKMLIEKDGDLSVVNSSGEAIEALVVDQKEEILAYLLENGMDPNFCPNEEMPISLMSRACEKGYISMVKLLVKYGADVRITDGSEMAPIHIAADKDNDELVKYLLEVNNNIDLPDNYGYTALKHAKNSKSEKVLKLLADRNATKEIVQQFEAEQFDYIDDGTVSQQ